MIKISSEWVQTTTNKDLIDILRQNWCETSDYIFDTLSKFLKTKTVYFGDKSH